MSCQRVGDCPPAAMSCRTCEWFQPDPVAATPSDVKSAIRSALAAAPEGLTFEELAARAGLNENTTRGRLSEMERAGVVRRLRRRHRTTAGRRAQLYTLSLAPALLAGGAFHGGRP